MLMEIIFALIILTGIAVASLFGWIAFLQIMLITAASFLLLHARKIYKTKI
jgi:hypothetical protein